MGGLFCSDGRRLNNIAVIEQDDRYDYCPIFDNGAGQLSNEQSAPMDVAPSALASALKARPFSATFARQMNTARSLYGPQLMMPKLTAGNVQTVLQPVLEYCPQRNRGIIVGRGGTCILIRQKTL